MKIAVPQLYEAILTRIRQKIEDSEISQTQIGDALGLKQSAVSYLLKGKTKLSMEQFLLLADLLGEAPNQLLAEADASFSENRPMPAEMESILFKSSLHLMIYVAACRPIRAQEIATLHFPLPAVQAALSELTRAKVLSQNGETFVQKELQVVYVPTTKAAKEKRYRYQQEIHRICQAMYLKHWDNDEYKSKRFNYFTMGYFTPSQIRNIEESLWRAYEKMRAAHRENLARGFLVPTEKLTFWQAHMMLMTPLEE